MKSKGNSLSIIIPVFHEDERIAAVLENCKRMGPHEMIVVANGCSKQTLSIVQSFNCKFIEIDKPLGVDVGRTIGAMHATGNVLLFLDSDYVVDSRLLKRFLNPILYGGAHAVLNHEELHGKKGSYQLTTRVWWRMMNEMAGRPELGSDSLCSAPHALTKEAVKFIGVETLAKPALAQWKLCHSPFPIAHQFGIDTVVLNGFSPKLDGTLNTELSLSEQRTIGDHLEVFDKILPRNSFTDGGRRRDIYNQIEQGKLSFPVLSRGKLPAPSSLLYGGKKLSVIIPAKNEQSTIMQVLQQVKQIDPWEIIVVVNGSGDRTAELSKNFGATTLLFEESLGTDTGRAIGAAVAEGDILLFTDGDFVIPAYDLYPFALSIEKGFDVALNDLNHHMELRQPMTGVTAAKYALNLALGRKDLGNTSMVSVPFAMCRNALKRIGYSQLICPPKAYMSCILEGFVVAYVHRVEVERLNRIRPEKHFSLTGMAPAVEQILGDHVEAFHTLLTERGSRGGFYDGDRRWDIMQEWMNNEI